MSAFLCHGGLIIACEMDDLTPLYDLKLDQKVGYVWDGLKQRSSGRLLLLSWGPGALLLGVFWWVGWGTPVARKIAIKDQAESTRKVPASKEQWAQGLMSMEPSDKFQESMGLRKD